MSILSFKNRVNLSNYFSVGWLILSSIFISKSSYAVTVAGCDQLGTWCDITPKPHLSDFRAYAKKVEVWSAGDSQANINEVNARIDRKVNEQNTARDQAVNALNKSIQNIRNDLTDGIQKERQHTDGVRDQIRNSLRDELQRLLRSQTCEDRVIPDSGTPGRAASVAAKIDCIKTALNNWRGVNAEGRRIVVADGNALSREQVAQMLRSLELLLGDADVTPTQRQFIADTENQFVFFNLM
ncbi:MAG: hypothetical protein ACO3A2_03605 [Bdellovibrionia bacterium]